MGEANRARTTGVPVLRYVDGRSLAFLITGQLHMDPTVLTVLQTFVAMSVIYVWVVRYSAVLHDFQTFKLPDWLRDVTGAGKLTGAALLLGVGEGLEGIGAAIIGSFMLAAVVMHLRAKNPLRKMMPSIGLGAISWFVVWWQFAS
jgi:hypothetical protein